MYFIKEKEKTKSNGNNERNIKFGDRTVGWLPKEITLTVEEEKLSTIYHARAGQVFICVKYGL